MRGFVALTILAAVAIPLSGCTTTVAPLPTPTPVATPAGNNELRIVDLELASGDTANFAPAQEAGTSLAEREINEGGGVLSKPITVWHRTDANVGTLSDAAAKLQVDAAIVAPSPTSLAALVKPAETAKVALVGIGTAQNLATPTVTPYPDASLVPASGSSATSATSRSASVLPSASGSATTTPAATRAPGSPAVPSAEFSARLKSSNPFLTDLTYGAESYQAVVALALAALVSKDDAGSSLVSGLQQVTTGDVVCTDFASCKTVLGDNRAIKYVGPAGQMAYDARTGVLTFGL